MGIKKAENLAKSELLKKLMRYCTYQERCHYEVQNKLKELKVSVSLRDEIIGELITSGFLNEERFAKTFARGKFRLKKWGREKIKFQLKQKKVSDYCILKALDNIENDEYQETMKALISDKLNSKRADNIYQLRKKVADALIQKGYESQLVWEIIIQQF